MMLREGFGCVRKMWLDKHGSPEQAEYADPDREPPAYIAKRCEGCRWLKHCQTRRDAQHDISLLNGTSSKTHRALRELGIETLQDIAGMDAESLRRVKGIKTTAEGHIAQAQAWVSGQPVWIDHLPDVLTQGGWMFDIETIPTASYPADLTVWSIGWGNPSEDYTVVVVAPRYAGETYQVAGLTIQAVRDVHSAWRQMLAAVEADTTPIYHWTGFDHSGMKSTAEPEVYAAMRDRLHDLHTTVNKTVRFPAMGTSIKTIGRYLGFDWAGYDSFMQAYQDYRTWLIRGSQPHLHQAAQYQIDDVRALVHLWRFMMGSRIS
jgi:predicted RecB family nuclease